MVYECLCCNYRTQSKQHLQQHERTLKHRNISANAQSTLEKYTTMMEELGQRHIKEVEDLYVRQEQERKELDQETRFELCKKLVMVLNE